MARRSFRRMAVFVIEPTSAGSMPYLFEAKLLSILSTLKLMVADFEGFNDTLSVQSAAVQSNKDCYMKTFWSLSMNLSKPQSRYRRSSRLYLRCASTPRLGLIKSRVSSLNLFGIQFQHSTLHALSAAESLWPFPCDFSCFSVYDVYQLLDLPRDPRDPWRIHSQHQTTLCLRFHLPNSLKTKMASDLNFANGQVTDVLSIRPKPQLTENLPASPPAKLSYEQS